MIVDSLQFDRNPRRAERWNTVCLVHNCNRGILNISVVISLVTGGLAVFDAVVRSAGYKKIEFDPNSWIAAARDG